MKAITLGILSLLLCLGTLQAQETSVGVKAGVNIANLKTESSPNPFKSITGFHAGLLYHVHINENWAVQPEVVFSRQGAKTSGTELRLGYLNVPVLVQYMFSNGLRLQTGPQAGILMSAKSETGSVTADIKDDLKGFDLAWSAGLGYLSKMGLGVDARYNLGLSKINETGSDKIKNNVAQIGLFYQFK